MGDDDFSFDVRPFRFPSASGLTPHLQGTYRLNRDNISLNTDGISGFGGRGDKSKIWLTPRAMPARAIKHASGYASGSQTARSSNDRGAVQKEMAHKEMTRSDMFRAANPIDGKRKRSMMTQSIQGMNWRFLRQAPPTRAGTRMTGASSRMTTSSHGAMYVEPKGSVAGLPEGYWGSSEQERAFETLMKGEGTLKEEYRQFEKAVQRRIAAVQKEERAQGRGYKWIQSNMRDMDPGSTEHGDAGQAQGQGHDDSSSGNSDVEITQDDEGNEEDEEAAPKAPLHLPPKHAPRESARLDGCIQVDAPVGSARSSFDTSDGNFPAGRLPPAGAQTVSMGSNAGFIHRGEGARPRSREKDTRSGMVKSGRRVRLPDDEVLEGEHWDDDDDNGLSNPNMAPCIIWHTPMRVKIAANLPQELRKEVQEDATFVKDDRVVPDIWDQRFLPVSRRSVAAVVPKNCTRHRQYNYGAWYLPVQNWQGSGAEKKMKMGGGHVDDDEDVAALMDKMEREIIKLSSSKMFYQYIKDQKLRVPHYLRKMEKDDVHEG